MHRDKVCHLLYTKQGILEMIPVPWLTTCKSCTLPGSCVHTWMLSLLWPSRRQDCFQFSKQNAIHLATRHFGALPPHGRARGTRHVTPAQINTTSCQPQAFTIPNLQSPGGVCRWIGFENHYKMIMVFVERVFCVSGRDPTSRYDIMKGRI